MLGDEFAQAPIASEVTSRAVSRTSRLLAIDMELLLPMGGYDRWPKTSALVPTGLPVGIDVIAFFLFSECVGFREMDSNGAD